MGFDLSIGCKSCKMYIYTGAMKAWKFNGFQLGNDRTIKFLEQHLANKDCELIIANTTFDLPWDDDDEWEEVDENRKNISSNINNDIDLYFEVGCVDCKKYIIIDSTAYKTNDFEVKKDIEFLAELLSFHSKLHKFLFYSKESKLNAPWYKDENWNIFTYYE